MFIDKNIITFYSNVKYAKKYADYSTYVEQEIQNHVLLI